MSNLDRINAAQSVSRLDPFQNQNEFDYNAWSGKEAQIKLLSVTWESDYKNAVNWEKHGVEGRDAWFQGEHEDELNISTGWNFKRAMQWSPSEGKFIGEISVPEPIENVRHYNYLYLQDYSKPVPFNTGKKVTDYFYFITAANADSANKTTLYLSVDAWTMFFHEANIVAVNLERGHWGHKQITAEDFLENPLDAPVDLTVHEEGLPTIKPMVSYSNLLSLTESEPRVCIATTAAFEEDRLGAQWSPDTFSWGDPFAGRYAGGDDWNSGFVDELGFEGEFKPGDAGSGGGVGLGSLPSPAPHAWVFDTPEQETAAGSVKVYSTDLKTFDRFITAARENMPQIFETIKAFYVLPSALIEESEEFSLASYEGAKGSDMFFRRVFPQPQAQKLADVEITNELFGYGEELSKFAKAYTSQFAQLKISDFSGNAAVLGVEELAGDLEFYGRASSTFPFLKVQAFLNGIGGNQEKTYAIKPLNDMNAQGFRSKWTDFLWDLDIPTFTVAVSQKEINGAYNIDTWKASVKNAGIEAEKAMLDADLDKKWRDERIDHKYKRSDLEYMINTSLATHDFNVEDERLNHDYDIKERELDFRYGDDFATGSLFKRINLDKTLAENSESLSYDTSKIATDASFDIAETVADYGLESAQLSANTSFDSARIENEMRTGRGGFLGNDHWTRLWPNYMPGSNVLENVRTSIRESIAGEALILERTLARNDRNLNHEIDTMNIDHAFFEAEQNALTADWISDFNLYSANVEQLLGVQGSMIGMKHAVTSSMIAVPASFLAGPAVGAAATAGGIAYTASSLITGLAEVEVAAEAAQHQSDKAQASHLVMDSWQESGGEWSYEGFEVALPPGSSLNKTLAFERRSLDQDIRNKVRAARELSTDTNYEARDKMMELDFYIGEASNHIGRYASLEVAGISHTSSLEAAEKSKTSEDAIREETRDITVLNIGSKHTMEDEILTGEGELERFINGNNRALRSGINMDTNILRSENIQDRLDMDLAEIALDTQESTEIYENSYKKINNDYDKFRNSLIAETNRARHGAPYEFGAPSTENPNTFGQWGLEVSVERISKAAERDVASNFLKYGYTMPGTLVENPVLGQMSDFSYWQCQDAWIVSPQLADSLALIIKSMFIEGVTLWEDPDAVRLTDIKENK